jgi:tetratricopeptide (TPR) repeat protein
MNKGLKRVVLFMTLQSVFCHHSHSQETDVVRPVYDSTLLQSGRYNAAIAGLTELDFSEARSTLLAMQSEITNYSESQQAQYWYYLAVSAWQMGLSSDQVIPNIEKTLSFSDSIEDYDLFQILMNAKDMARDYRHFHHAINYIRRIKQLVGESPDTNGLLIPSPVDADYAIAHHEIGENNKAIVYLKSLILRTEMAGDKPDRYWFQVLSSAQVLTEDISGAIKTLKKQIDIYPHSNSVMYLGHLEALQSEHSKRF